MSVVGSITEVSTFTATVPTPGVGTSVLAGDVIAGEQALANRTLWLRDRSTGKVVLTDAVSSQVALGTHDWTIINSGPLSGLSWEQRDEPDGALYFSVDVPSGFTLATPHMRIRGIGHGALPATMPTVQLVSYDITGTETIHFTQVDTTALVATYDTSHSVTASGAAITSDRSLRRYYVRVFGEAGAGALGAARLLLTEASITVGAP